MLHVQAASFWPLWPQKKSLKGVVEKNRTELKCKFFSFFKLFFFFFAQGAEQS